MNDGNIRRTDSQCEKIMTLLLTKCLKYCSNYPIHLSTNEDRSARLGSTSEHHVKKNKPQNMQLTIHLTAASVCYQQCDQPAATNISADIINISWLAMENTLCSVQCRIKVLKF